MGSGDFPGASQRHLLVQTKESDPSAFGRSVACYTVLVTAQSDSTVRLTSGSATQ